MAMTFLQVANKIFLEENQPLSPNEIWRIAVSKGYDKLIDTKGKTPWSTLYSLIFVDVRDNPSSIFVLISERPKRFILKSQAGPWTGKDVVDIPVSIELKTTKPVYLEKDLHPLMVYYGFYYLKAYLKTINHNKSGKKSYGEWVHPDLVGCYYPFSDWESEVVEISTTMGNTAVKLFSFELKRELSFLTLRESFFQAVSNSSWANEAYLVAAEIDNDDDFRDELRRLSTSFGIGVIRLNTEEPDSCEILFPARSRDSIDWETVNKLSSMNTDFREFLKRVQNDLKSREVRKEMYDKVLQKEDLTKIFNKKIATN